MSASVVHGVVGLFFMVVLPAMIFFTLYFVLKLVLRVATRDIVEQLRMQRESIDRLALQQAEASRAQLEALNRISTEIHAAASKDK
jgi:signal transduction histidine kinase